MEILLSLSTHKNLPPNYVSGILSTLRGPNLNLSLFVFLFLKSIPYYILSENIKKQHIYIRLFYVVAAVIPLCFSIYFFFIFSTFSNNKSHPFRCFCIHLKKGKFRFLCKMKIVWKGKTHKVVSLRKRCIWT